MTPDLLPSLAKAVTSESLLKEIYTDLARPGVSQVGKALAGVLGLGNTILWPVHLLNERASAALKANLERYRRKLEQQSEEAIAQVAPEVGVPVAEKLAFVSNQELADMYTTLLRSASCQATSAYAHPAFVNIINSLSPDEAVLLRSMAKHGYLPFAVEEQLGLRVVTFREEVSEQLVFPRNVQAYLSNFEGLGLTVMSLGREAKGALKVGAHEQPVRRLGTATLTAFGEMFCRACVTVE
jgi:hypothetical protein